MYVCDEGQCDKESPKICVMRLGIACSLISLAVVSPPYSFSSLTSFASLSLTHMRYLLRHHLISFLRRAAVFFPVFSFHGCGSVAFPVTNDTAEQKKKEAVL